MHGGGVVNFNLFMLFQDTAVIVCCGIGETDEEKAVCSHVLAVSLVEVTTVFGLDMETRPMARLLKQATNEHAPHHLPTPPTSPPHSLPFR